MVHNGKEYRYMDRGMVYKGKEYRIWYLLPVCLGPL